MFSACPEDHCAEVLFSKIILSILVLEKQLALDSMKETLDRLRIEKDEEYASLLNDKNTIESNLREQMELLTLAKENLIQDGEFSKTLTLW